ELIGHPRERVGGVVLVGRGISLRAVHFLDAYGPIVGIDKVTFDVSILVNRSNQVVIEDQLRMAPIGVSNLYLSTENIISKQRKTRRLPGKMRRRALRNLPASIIVHFADDDLSAP